MKVGINHCSELHFLHMGCCWHWQDLSAAGRALVRGTNGHHRLLCTDLKKGQDRHLDNQQ